MPVMVPNTPRYLLLFTLLLAAVLLVACDQDTPTPPPTPVPLVQDARLGFVFDTTGTNSAEGVEQQAAAQLAVDEINVAGHEPRLVPVFKATDGSASQALGAFQTLIISDSVQAILGPTSSVEARAAHPIAQKASVPVLAVSNTVGGVTDVGDYVFRVSLSEADVIPTTVAVAKDKLKVSQVCLLYALDDAFSRAEADVFRAELDKKGVKVLGEMTFASADSDFKPQLRAIKELKPDAIVVSALAGPAKLILEQARTEIGIGTNVYVIGGLGFTAPQAVQDPAAAEGLVVGTAWSSVSLADLNVKFAQEYEKATGQPPGVEAAQAYAGVYIAYDAIKRANIKGKTLEEARSAIRDNLRSTSSLPTVLGLFSFTDRRDAKYPVPVQLFHNGKFEVVK